MYPNDNHENEQSHQFPERIEVPTAATVVANGREWELPCVLAFSTANPIAANLTFPENGDKPIKYIFALDILKAAVEGDDSLVSFGDVNFWLDDESTVYGKHIVGNIVGFIDDKREHFTFSLPYDTVSGFVQDTQESIGRMRISEEELIGRLTDTFIDGILGRS